MTDILLDERTPIVWADLADYAGDGGVRTNQIDLTSIGVGAARQGDKVDLGNPRAAAYGVTLAIEMDVAPAVATRNISLWWAASVNAAAALVNPGGVVGADGAYTGTAGDSLEDSILQCTLIGILPATSDADGVIQVKPWLFSPETRYGTPIVFNETDQAFEGDAVEMFLTFTPIYDESQ